MRWSFLGLVHYERALLLQKTLVEQRYTPTLLLLEHPPTYTLGRRFQGEESVHLDRLRSFAHVRHTNRGGQITFHGPGQLVGYPIMNLKEAKLGVRDYVCRLESMLIHLLKTQYQLNASRCEHTGVWIDDRKIAALGIAVSRQITSHGFALNCNTDLSYFNAIVPCGIPDKSVTSLAKEMKDSLLTVDKVLPHLVKSFGHTFGLEMKQVPADEIWNQLPQ